MTRSPPSTQQVAILSADAADAAAFCHRLQQVDYQTAVYTNTAHLEDGLARNPCFAVILDADSIELSNFIIRRLKSHHPEIHFLLASRNPFHPELQESISRFLFACLRKPADLEEITYLFRSISRPILSEMGTIDTPDLGPT